MKLINHKQALFVSFKDKPERKTSFGMILTDEEFAKALSEWEAQLIPVKEEERFKFIELAFNIILSDKQNFQIYNEALQNGIDLPTDSVEIKHLCCRGVGSYGDCDRQCNNNNVPLVFAYLKTQDKPKGMDKISIYKFQLENIIDALRITSNIHDSQNLKTSHDRQVVNAYEYAKNALNGEIDKRVAYGIRSEVATELKTQDKESNEGVDVVLLLNKLYSDLTTEATYNGTWFDNWLKKNVPAEILIKNSN